MRIQFLVSFLICFFITEGALACPGSLRAFNKKIEGKPACVLENNLVGKLELSSGFNYVILGAVFVGNEQREKKEELKD